MMLGIVFIVPLVVHVLKLGKIAAAAGHDDNGGSGPHI